jgi:5-methylcytosine-specific restriction endonuclease McrA
MNELRELLIEIQDRLVPILDSYEQAIYHYLFRHTYLSGKEEILFSTRTAEIGFGSGDNSKKPSWKTRSDKLKSLEKKGCVRIVERSNKGMLVKILLPSEITTIQKQDVKKEEVDLESLDFHNDKRLLSTLLARESYRCFYTGKKISENNCYLDHVFPQSNGGDNSYRNIVATCFDANSLKSDKPVDEFIRQLYRDGLLSLEEFNTLKQKVSDLQAGKLVPNYEQVQNAMKS